MALSRTIIKLAWVTRLLLWWIAFCDWITWGGGKKNAWQISKADALLPTGLNLQRATLMHFICSWADRVAIVSVFPGSHLKALNGQLFLTELDVRGEAGQLAPAELWSLAGQKSCQVSPMCVCVCLCAYKALLLWQQHPNRTWRGWVPGCSDHVWIFLHVCILLT